MRAERCAALALPAGSFQFHESFERGFRLPPDAPEVLDFYAERSPIFLAAAFDADAAAKEKEIMEV